MGSPNPDRLVFSVKVPQIITHDKILVGCDEEFELFVDTMDILDEKLGPIVLVQPEMERGRVFR
jgi:uncharacterized protein YecE (DUF72 family)